MIPYIFPKHKLKANNNNNYFISSAQVGQKTRIHQRIDYIKLYFEGGHLDPQHWETKKAFF